MLQVARLSPKLLAEAAPLVADFVTGQQNADGGFNDRAGISDLYYSVFGLESLIALRADLPAGKSFLIFRCSAKASASIWFILACLARCWADVNKSPPADAAAIAERIERHRSADGDTTNRSALSMGRFMAALSRWGLSGFETGRCRISSEFSTASPPIKPTMARMRIIRIMPIGLTSATAAAATILRQLQEPVESASGEWLLERAHKDGGFLAAPQAPIPDLLSTATALHALSGLPRRFRAHQRSLPRFYRHALDSRALFLATGAKIFSIASTPTMVCWHWALKL